MDKDITMKEVLKTLAEDIALYILNIEVGDLHFVDKELKRIEKRECDLVATCLINGKKQILHIEIQNDNDAKMANRMLRYYTDIRTQFPELKINQYVIYIGKGKLTMPSSIQESSLDYSYQLIDMYQIDCESLIQLDTPDSLVLSVLCDFKDKNELDVLTFLLTRLRQLLSHDKHQLDRYLLMLDTLSDNRHLKPVLKEAKQMLRNIQLEKTATYEVAYERGAEDGLTKGKIQGIEEGVMQGKIQSALAMMEKMDLSAEEVAETLDIPLEELLAVVGS